MLRNVVDRLSTVSIVPIISKKSLYGKGSDLVLASVLDLGLTSNPQRRVRALTGLQL